ncbi:hypothetical protein [Halodesulfovibrio aestuarii]|uniref:Uncharacterized protein n=1 Tax=Halodesulfovibrio aestuarii TaxID=126333 RepID=A0ABV4JVY4_9BACT
MSVIALTPLELAFGGAFLSLVVGICVRQFGNSSFVNRSDFDTAMQTMKKNNEIQFRMLRAMVLYLPVDDAVKKEILNERGSE